MDYEDCEKRVKELKKQKTGDEMFCIDIYPNDKNFGRVMYACDIGIMLNDGLMWLICNDGKKEEQILPSNVKKLELVKNEQCAQSFNELMEGISRLIYSGVQGAIDSLKQ